MELSYEVSGPDGRIQSILTNIEKVKLEKVANKTFVDTDVYLDGRIFQNCIFENCRMFVKLGHFSLRGPAIHVRNCEIVASGPARDLLNFAALVSRPTPPPK